MDPHHVLESSESYKRFIVSPFDRAAFLSVLFFIVVLFFIQTTVIIRLTGGLLQVDLLTPFIVLLGIYHSNTKSCFFTTITALFLEAQGSLPGGFFLSSYWMICLFILSSFLVLDNIGFEKSFKLSILTLTNTVNSEMFSLQNLNFSNLLISSKISLIIFMIIGKIELVSIFLIFKKLLFKD